jgi:hypothetical protein
MRLQTRILGIPVDTTARELEKARYRFVSSGVADLPDSNFGFRRSVIVRDPDGHSVQVAGQ